jgi:hypothetical protein
MQKPIRSQLGFCLSVCIGIISASYRHSSYADLDLDPLLQANAITDPVFKMNLDPDPGVKLPSFPQMPIKRCLARSSFNSFFRKLYLLLIGISSWFIFSSLGCFTIGTGTGTVSRSIFKYKTRSTGIKPISHLQYIVNKV